MRWTAVAVLVVLASPLQAQYDRDTLLRVLRHTPNDSATPGAYVAVTFDRPVAGALDQSVDASKLFRIEPTVAGSVAWRDPVTIRFLPDEPLAPGAQFTVTIDNAFSAIDGSRLPAPFRFRFRVPGPALLSYAPRKDYGQALAPNHKLLLLYSAPVDLAALGRVTRLELDCGGKLHIKLAPVAQRAIQESDGYELQYSRGYGRDTVADRFRRVVELAPESPIPGDCDGWLVVPRSVAGDATADVDRYAVRTRPSFRVERFECLQDPSCAVGMVHLQFSTPVKREDVERFVRFEPPQSFTLQSGRNDGSQVWMLRAALAPRTKYTLVIGPAIRDVYGRPLVGDGRRTIETADRIPQVAYGTGLLTIPRRGPRVIALQHVNVDTALITVFRVPDHNRARTVGFDPWRVDAEPSAPIGNAVEIRWPLRGSFNRDTTTLLPFDQLVAGVGGTGLLAIRVDIAAASGGSPVDADRLPLAFVQSTDLAAHTKLSGTEGTVFVTGVSDGLPRRGARVTLFDERDVAVARGMTNGGGLAALVAVQSESPARVIRRAPRDEQRLAGTRYVEVSHDGDVSITPIADAGSMGRYRYSPPSPLDPGRLGGRGRDDAQIAGLVFTERGIYRPGEMVFAKAIVRMGILGALRRPARTDSVRWVIKHQPNYWDDDGAQTLRDTVVALSAFGTTVDALRLRPTVQLGRYVIEVRLQGRSDTLTAATGEFRVGEYRAPEFLADVATDSAPRFVRDTVTANVAARYLFGAPMRNARVEWSTTTAALAPGQFDIPNTAGWVVGESGDDREHGASQVGTRGEATLDSAGRAALRIPVPDAVTARPSRMEIHVAVTDVNRQAVIASTGLTIHPAAVYIAARHAKGGWIWNVGTPQRVELRTVRPDGRAVAGVPVQITVVRRHWVHGAAAFDGRPGGWRVVTDTLTRDSVVTGDGVVSYLLTPREGGDYRVRLTGPDEQGRVAVTTLAAYAVGGGRPWWSSDSPYRLPLVATGDRLVVGDTATVVFDSPFDRAEAWLTVEREGLLEQRRLSVRRGATTVRIPVSERYAPNVFVSVLLVKTLARNTAPPDSAPQVLRAGYTELHVDPAIKRLRVSVMVIPPERGPGETTAVHLDVRDRRRRGMRSEVALWAVDEGVLALTEYRAPEPVAGLYEPRGVGLQLRSTLTSLVLDPVLQSAARRRAAARRAAARRSAAARSGAMPTDTVTVSRLDTAGARLTSERAIPTSGLELSAVAAEIPIEVLRWQFRSTAFFLGNVVTDDTGRAVVRVKLPDNLTTYTVFAMAVSNGDRYGAGLTSFLVTRPLVARPALPRFVRPSDAFVAGPVVNARDGGAQPVRVDAEVEGATLVGAPRQSVTLEAGRGAEARFSFVVPPRDVARAAAVFRFGVVGLAGRDAVETRLDVRPDFHPRAHTVVGVVRDAASVEIRLPADIDPARSSLTMRVGTSPLVPMLAAYERLRVYPYDCTEQISSGGRALVAIYRAAGGTRRATSVLGANPIGRLQQLADELSLRQREDGAIGFWRSSDWSSAWLSAYAGLFLLDARSVGVIVEQRVIDKLTRYLGAAAADSLPRGGMNPTERLERRLALGERVAAVDFLRRAGRTSQATEDRLLARTADMVWEDRLRLAEVLSRRADAAPQVRALLDEAWRGVAVAAARVDLPDTAHTRRDFPSRIRPAARLLTATLAIRPDHALIGALIETVLQQGRAERYWAWNTQDYASVVTALAQFGSGAAAEGGRRVTIMAAGRTLLDRVARPQAADVHGGGDVQAADSAVSLTNLLRRDGGGGVTLPLRLVASEPGDGIFYAVTVEEVPARAPVRPDVQGIAVERWYERFDDGKPVASVEEGELVRVRLRITVPADRHFVVVDDALPAGLEPLDLSLRTSATLGPFVGPQADTARRGDRDRDGPRWQAWLYGSWDNGWWSPWDHKEIRDDRVVYFARALWKGTYTASYVARATTRGTFVRPPAHAEEMYNPGVHGRSDGGRLVVTGR